MDADQKLEVQNAVDRFRDAFRATLLMVGLVPPMLERAYSSMVEAAARDTPDDPDPLAYFGYKTSHEESEDGETQYFSDPLGRSDVEYLIAGPLYGFLVQQWIVFVYERWESHFRPLVAHALGIEKKKLSCSFFGDLRLYRHDIIHSSGIATADNAMKATDLDWAIVGRQIVPAYSTLQKLSLARWVLRFPLGADKDRAELVAVDHDKYEEPENVNIYRRSV